MRIPIIIDQDPGIDDFISLMLIRQKNFLEPKLITAVDGNVNIEETTRNIRLITKFLNLDVPIASSFENVNEDKRNENLHGKDGLLGKSHYFSFNTLPDISKKDAIQCIKDVLDLERRMVKLLLTGPMSTFIKFIKKYPRMLTKIGEIAISESSFDYIIEDDKLIINTDLDIDTIKNLIKQRIDLTVISKKLIDNSKLDEDSLNKIASVDSEMSKFSYELLKEFYDRGGKLEAPLQVLSLSNPEYFTGEIKKINIILKRHNGELIEFKQSQRIYYLNEINRKRYQQEIIKIFL